MPLEIRQVWVDDKEGPNAFASTNLFNQNIWNEYPALADAVMCSAIATGGFHEDHINRRVGNYEGQILAIRTGLVDRQKYGWCINDNGRSFLRSHGHPVPTFLPVIDSWHQIEVEFCMYETTYKEEPALKFAKELIPEGRHLCMHPLFRKADAEALRDYLSNWLSQI